MNPIEFGIIKNFELCDFQKVSLYLSDKKDQNVNHFSQDIPKMRGKAISLKQNGFYDGCIYKFSNNKFIKRGEYIKRLDKKSIIINSTSLNECEKSQWLDVVNQPDAHWVAKALRPNDKKWLYISKLPTFASERKKYEKASYLNRNEYLLDDFVKKNLFSPNMKLRIFCVGIRMMEKTSCRPGLDLSEKYISNSQGIFSLDKDNIHLLGHNKIRIEFIAKSFVPYDRITLFDSDIYESIQHFKDMPGNKLFPLDEV